MLKTPLENHLETGTVISRFVEHSDVAKGSLTGDTVAFLWWFSKGAFTISLVHFSLIHATRVDNRLGNPVDNRLFAFKRQTRFLQGHYGNTMTPHEYHGLV